MRKRVRHLRLVTQSSKAQTKKHKGVQRRLFAGESKSLLVFLDMSVATEGMFINVIRSGVLRVFDLRVAPRFDLGQLNRGRVFELFDALRIDYFDIAGLLVFSGSASDLDPTNAALAIAHRLNQSDLPGPNLFLLENDISTKVFSEGLPLSLPTPSKSAWEILIPYDAQPSAMHASPH